MIRKTALSLLVIGGSGAYVWSQSATQSSDDLAEAPPATASALPDAVAAVAVEPPLIVRDFANSGDKAATAPLPPLTPVRVRSIAIDPAEASPPQAPSVTASELPRTRAGAGADVKPIKASAKVATKPHKGLADGTFDGPAVDAFYGLVQIEANVQNGKLASIRVLQFPSDRRTSIMINRQALPVLRLEAVAAQSADVDIVSGATLTSEAFIESLGAALKQASA